MHMHMHMGKAAHKKNEKKKREREGEREKRAPALALNFPHQYSNHIHIHSYSSPNQTKPHQSPPTTLSSTSNLSSSLNQNSFQFHLKNTHTHTHYNVPLPTLPLPHHTIGVSLRVQKTTLQIFRLLGIRLRLLQERPLVPSSPTESLPHLPRPRLQRARHGREATHCARGARLPKKIIPLFQRMLVLSQEMLKLNYITNFFYTSVYSCIVS